MRSSFKISTVFAEWRRRLRRLDAPEGVYPDSLPISDYV